MEKLINISKVAELLGVSKNTLRIWDENGRLKPIRTKGGHRRYKLSEIQILQEDNDMVVNQNCVAIYCRVSSHDQKKKGDLERQKGRLLEYCVGKEYNINYVLEDVSSGMKGRRTQLNKLYNLVINRKINRVIVEHKDRLTRFLFEVFEVFFNSYNVEIEYISETLTKSNETELVEDILSLMASFSGRIYGQRSAKIRNKNNECN